MLEAMLHLVPIALCKVCAPDAHAEERVASKCRVLRFAVEEYRAVCVAGSLQHLQLVVAETDGVTVAEQPSGRGLGIVELYAKEIGGLVVQVLYQGLVFCANLYPQFVFLVDEGVAEVVVQMSMSAVRSS